MGVAHSAASFFIGCLFVPGFHRSRDVRIDSHCHIYALLLQFPPPPPQSLELFTEICLLPIFRTLFEFACFAAEEKWAEARGGREREREKEKERREREEREKREKREEREKRERGGEIASL